MLVNCKYCNKEFKPPTRDINRGNGKFCSKSCASSFRKGVQQKTRLVFICSNPKCGKEFLKLASNFRKNSSKSGLRFCNRKCKDEAQSLEVGLKAIQPSHFGTKDNSSPTSRNYRPIAAKHLDMTKCNRCLFNLRPEVLQVHHKDRNRRNNTLENLEVLCPTCHIIDHYDNKDGLYNSRS